MIDKITKILFVTVVFIFVVSFSGIGIAALFDKSVVQKVVKTVVTKEVEEDESVATPEPTNITSSNTTNTGTTQQNITNSPVTPTVTTAPTSSGYTLADVSAHGSSNGCWVVYSGNVYALGSYPSSSHPAGPNIPCGGDMTSLLNSSHNHSGLAISLLKSFYKGPLI
ncbi:MAG: cytochrome b5-like heme/steroid binding domain-containing protein [bacterium]